MATTTTRTQTQPQITAQPDSDFIPRGLVTVPLFFYNPPTDGSKPFNYVETPPAGKPQRNYSDTSIPVAITDLRGQEHAFSLDTNAFATFSASPSASKEIDFTSDDSVKAHYYPEVEQAILQHVPGARRVVLFDHTIRRADPSSPRNPVTRVHIDQTKSSAEARVRHHLPPDDVADLLQGRVRIINVWRPLNGPVQSFPLSFADSSSVPDDAIVPVQHRYPDRTGETAAIRHTEGQKWFYLSGMTNEERLLLQCYDSELGARVPHTAFVDPRTPEGARGRESIEVRALVFG